MRLSYTKYGKGMHFNTINLKHTYSNNKVHCNGETDSVIYSSMYGSVLGFESEVSITITGAVYLT
jgi:hypothetical protein